MLGLSAHADRGLVKVRERDTRESSSKTLETSMATARKGVPSRRPFLYKSFESKEMLKTEKVQIHGLRTVADDFVVNDLTI